MTAENLENTSNPPQKTAEIFPGLRGLVVASTQGDILQQVGTDFEDYGESLGYIHQLAEKVGEVLAFDEFRSLYAKDSERQFYSEVRGENHIAAEFTSKPTLSQIKTFVAEEVK